MKELIALLDKDHEMVSSELEKLDNLVSSKNLVEKLKEILTVVFFFEKFVVSEHHKREEEVLYKWMLGQNKHADKELIQKIVDEHKALEKIVTDVREKIEIAIKTNETHVAGIGAELSLLVSKYREHIERESGFIFIIASALS